jgi:hypothetical protein
VNAREFSASPAPSPWGRSRGVRRQNPCEIHMPAGPYASIANSMTT